MFTSLFLKLILSLVTGAAIGLERESVSREAGAVGGIRTFSLISLLGALTGLFVLNNLGNFALLIGAAFFLLLISYYIGSSYSAKHFGLTSELSVLITYLIGFLFVTVLVPTEVTVALFVVLMLVLSIKSKTTQLSDNVSRNELQSFISYAVIALVVLPFLPDVEYTLKDMTFLGDILKSLNFNIGGFGEIGLINLRKVWLVVVLITGIDVLGYLLGRFFGKKKGFVLAGFFAGFVSSTSATQSLAQKSKKNNSINYLVGAAVLANMASFIQIFLLVSPLNIGWMFYILPTISAITLVAATIALIWIKYRKGEVDIEKEDPSGKMFSLMPAIKFAGLLIVIKIITKLSLVAFGKYGFILSSVLGSLAGLDAIIVNLAEMAGKNISYQFALLTFVLVNTTNLISKTIYSYLQGSRSFALKFFFSVLPIAAASFIVYWFSV